MGRRKSVTARITASAQPGLQDGADGGRGGCRITVGTLLGHGGRAGWSTGARSRWVWECEEGQLVTGTGGVAG